MGLVAKLADKSAAELFEEYSIQQLQQLNLQLAADVHNKRLELRTLVGNNYRDLLKVADDIIHMNELSDQQTSCLSDLVYRKAKYDDKSLRNFNKFSSEVRANALEKTKFRNRPVLLRNIVDHLDFGLQVLREEVEDIQAETRVYEHEDGENSRESVSLQLVQLAKQFYLTESFFGDELKGTSFVAEKFGKMKQDFLQELRTEMAECTGDGDYEFALHLLVSHIIVARSQILKALEWYLDLRYDRVREFELHDLHNCLSYMYNTLSYLGVFCSKLPTTLMRQIYSSTNSNWVANTSFKKYSRWLDIPAGYKVDFPLSLNELKNIPEGEVDKISETWKINVGAYLKEQIGKDFVQSRDIEALSSSLSRVFQSFKKFTSLVAIKYEDSRLLDSLLSVWRSVFFEFLESSVGNFQNISKLILETYGNSESLQSTRTTSGLNLFQYTDLTNIDLYLSQISNPSLYTIDAIVTQFGQFKQTLVMVLDSLQSLSKLSSSLTKQVLSIDDYEDDEYWRKTAAYLNDLVDEGICFVIDQLNSLITDFLKEIGKFVDSGEALPIKHFYIIRVLYQLRENININMIYYHFNRISISAQKFQTLDLSGMVDELLRKIFKPLVVNISSPFKNEVKQMIRKRPTEKYAEVALWTSSELDIPVPNVPSFELENVLYRLSCSLTNVAENPSEDFSDVYFSDTFAEAKVGLVDDLIDCLEIEDKKSDSCKDQKERPEEHVVPEESDIQSDAEMSVGRTSPEPHSLDSKTIALLTFADLVFLNCFKSNPLSEAALLDQVQNGRSKIQLDKLAEINPDLADIAYIRNICKGILDHFKGCMLMFGPLC
ncbi:hypothetical protein KL905_001715 [Ogataea polymorpha]|uniref:Conserved oligomeric Golgi complex subunit 1 n=1 Tax=Ogataea polymorpha TaxID=460523 RepID=A0A1B7SES2_9ASCO|nr:uncharacterized protein OGAPODRAFT_94805 [Ogataea polymorpha]KAG7905834.1 hypothetical protein KL906_004904 [Ogataea polymorpha]KAG7908274.1 hypothetical protein KL907_001764 [Ogataea polymorpha]KAG7921115.1 hypothetical protein KL927_000359 [Ogataea polymorpha]KAG7922494.1 hypothetical protein KL905_001715 [Ogataea polymorpha]KAG7940500.1 hypothetical protein KL904_000363 [Ogataea polymorpha]